uniref:Fe2OG dioxygenase domain-containing protein n=1 Tax=Leptocylindrus danicus TaxID=163516 RepID=A0A7S2KDS8_9STRA|mmetsp:Transcript_21729/g.32459  ORF Transcript_21729/g.32459 Transcript_21729/m.32459 type:complete len:644 (+) Transcript_21729:265-2196(+)
MATIRQRKPTLQRKKSGLIRFAQNITSQGGEDGIIAKIFELLPSPPECDGYYLCIDVGAWDGKHLSNTYNLLCAKEEPEQRWKGILIEPHPERFVDLKELHEPLGNICLNVCVSCQPESPFSLSNLLSDHVKTNDKTVDLLSIDVDGTDYWLMDDILRSQVVKARVICIEFNPTMPDDIIYIQERRDEIRHGSSLAALCELANQYSYVLVETTVFNAFFVLEDLYLNYLKDTVPIPDCSIEALHEVTMGTTMYQLYDGTLKLSGCKRMLWHRLPIHEDKIQILTEKERNFPFAPPSTTTSQETIINMSAYCMENFQNEKRAECRNKLLRSLQKDGFALITGTGLSVTACNNALRATDMFFNEADEKVRRSCLAKDRARRGYSPLNSENFASLVGNVAPNDLVRKFRVGAVEEKFGQSPLHRPNTWPSCEHWDEEKASFFQKSIQDFYADIGRASNAVVHAIREGLSNIESLNEENLQVLSMDENISHTSILTLLGYKKGARHQGKMKRSLVAPHTDVGVITILLFDAGDCAVLQRANNGQSISRPEKNWIDVNLPNLSTLSDPVLVVNIGDCLSEISGGTLPSTLHRVQPLPGDVPRNCLAFFVGLAPEAELMLPNRCAPMSYEEWRKERIEKASLVVRKGKG